MEPKEWIVVCVLEQAGRDKVLVLEDEDGEAYVDTHAGCMLDLEEHGLAAKSRCIFVNIRTGKTETHMGADL